MSEEQQQLSTGPDEPIVSGSILAGRYRLEKRLGKGGMAEVYLASDLELDGAPVALKVLDADLCEDEQQVRRFSREIQLTRQISSPYVIRTFDIGHHGKRLFFTMEYIEGVTLDEELAKGIELPRVVQIVRQLCLALEPIHAAGIVHRDLKPANIMLTASGAVKLTDFGVARPEVSDLTAHSEIVGSAQYLAPEGWTGAEPTAAMDIYALGVIWYQMVTGILPVDSKTPGELVLKHMRQRIVPPQEIKSGCPSWISELIVRMLAKQPDQRPRSVLEILAALDQYEGTVVAVESEIIELDEQALQRLHASQSHVPEWDERNQAQVAPPGGRDEAIPSGGFSFVRRSKHRAASKVEWVLRTALMVCAIALSFLMLRWLGEHSAVLGQSVATRWVWVYGLLMYLSIAAVTSIPWLVLLTSWVEPNLRTKVAAQIVMWNVMVGLLFFSKLGVQLHRTADALGKTITASDLQNLLVAGVQRWLDTLFANPWPTAYSQKVTSHGVDLITSEVISGRMVVEHYAMVLLVHGVIFWIVARPTLFAYRLSFGNQMMACFSCLFVWCTSMAFLVWFALRDTHLQQPWIQGSVGSLTVSIYPTAIAALTVSLGCLALFLTYLRRRAMTLDGG